MRTNLEGLGKQPKPAPILDYIESQNLEKEEEKEKDMIATEYRIFKDKAHLDNLKKENGEWVYYGPFGRQTVAEWKQTIDDLKDKPGY